jgi:hypothetical protein
MRDNRQITRDEVPHQLAAAADFFAFRLGQPEWRLGFAVKDAQEVQVTQHRQIIQKRLKCKKISSGAQVGNSESVPEFVRVSFLHLSPGSQPINKKSQTILVERPIGLADEGRDAGIVSVFTTCQAAPDRFRGNLFQIYGTSLTAFGTTGDTMPDCDLSSFEVNIVDGQGTQLSRP